MPFTAFPRVRMSRGTASSTRGVRFRFRTEAGTGENNGAASNKRVYGSPVTGCNCAPAGGPFRGHERSHPLEVTPAFSILEPVAPGPASRHPPVFPDCSITIYHMKGTYMKFLFAVLSSLILLAGCDKGSQQGGGAAKLETSRDSVSYSIGINIGMNMLRDSVEFNPAPLMRGLSDAALDTAQRLMKPSGVEQTLMNYQQELSQKRMESIRKKGEANLKLSEEWLANNAKKPGVVTLPSGLQYKIIKNGTGPKPTKDQLVTAHYRGTLIDGKQFDSSYDRKEPSTFRLSGVIPGWTEGLQLMSVGSKWEFYIPAKLGYGEQGSGPIGPNEALVFEVELLKVQ